MWCKSHIKYLLQRMEKTNQLARTAEEVRALELVPCVRYSNSIESRSVADTDQMRALRLKGTI